MAKENEDKYSKEQITSSKRYSKSKDILNALLDENKMYTFTEIDKIIENFKKRKV